MTFRHADLALVACGKRKQPHAAPARLLYDGPAFRMLRTAPVDFLIVSAKHGLLDGETTIPPYDQKLPQATDAAFNLRLRAALAQHLSAARYERVVVLLGERYARAVGPLSAYEWHDAAVTITSGRIGERLHQLRAWLDARAPPQER